MSAGAVAEAHADPGAAPQDARDRWTAGRVLRAVGALLFWTTAETLFLLPAGAADWAAFSAGRSYRPLVPPASGALLNLLVAAGFVWWFALRPAARRDARRRATFRLRAPAPGTWPRVAVAACGVAVLGNAAMLVLPRFLPFPDGNPLEAYARVPGGGAALLVLAAVVAPLLEEFFFRGWLQGALERRLRVWPAVLAAGFIFALAHGERFGFAPRFALALAAGYAAWATASVWPGVALHSAYNLALFAGGALLPAVLPAVPAMEAWADREEAAFFFWARQPAVFGGALLALALGAALVAWAVARLPRAVPAER